MTIQKDSPPNGTERDFDEGTELVEMNFERIQVVMVALVRERAGRAASARGEARPEQWEGLPQGQDCAADLEYPVSEGFPGERASGPQVQAAFPRTPPPVNPTTLLKTQTFGVLLRGLTYTCDTTRYMETRD